MGKFRLHTTNLLSGSMFIILGLIFIAYEGTSSLAGFYESNGATDLAFAAELWTNYLVRRVPAGALLGALAVLSAALILRRFLRRGEQKGSVEHRR